jgi:antitoxin MazE
VKEKVMVAMAQMARWGNSLAVRIPKNLADAAKLAEGDRLTLEVASQGAVTLKAVVRPATIDELVERITPDNRHGERTWGQAVGAERW